MTKICLKGTIYGGPHDGVDFTFNGESELPKDELLNHMVKLRIEGHEYRIIDLDKEKMTATILW